MAKQPCDVTGEWAGTWWPKTPTADEPGKSLTCTVVRDDANWRAVFRAECDQSYQFTVEMEGRPSGDVVLFKGTADLGEQGGVFDWIGRASDQEFVGFFTSSHYVGEFRLQRKK